MQDKSFQYQSVVIHLWPAGEHHASTRWRFTLECSSDGTRHGFTDPQALLAHIERTLTELIGEGPAPCAAPPSASFDHKLGDYEP